ncbi:MAG: LysR family transcriptional regulator [Hyphomicrobiales bacterium]|nr:LysR family transcriptional regulator [Hyphomicrobiales bacterium]
MDLRGIEIFLAICEKGGLTAAGAALGLTQAGVSQHLQKLERDVGLTLMDRTVRPPRLTPGGEYLRKRGRALMREIEDIRAGLQRYQRHDIPELRLGIIESVASALLPHLVRRLSRSVGSLSVTSGTTHPLLPELLRGELDMVISSEQIEDEATFATEPLLAEPVVMVLPKGRPHPRDWDEINAMAQDLDFIAYGTRRRLGRIVRHQFERFDVRTRGNLEFDSSVALFDLVTSGAGWAATTPMCMLCAGIDENDVEIVTFPDVTPMRSINTIWVREREDTSVHMVTALCRTVFAEIAPRLQRRAGGAGDRVQVLTG